MKMFYYFACIVFSVIFLSSCAPQNYERDPAVLFHKKALALVENEDYKRTNDALMLLIKKYDCTIKNSFRAGKDDGETTTAEYTLLIADKSFDEFVQELRFTFKNEIAEERVSQISLSEITSRTKVRKQRDIEYELRYLSSLYEQESNETIRQIRAAEIKRKTDELSATISDIESDMSMIDRSTVNIIWKQKAGNADKGCQKDGPRAGAPMKCNGPHPGAIPNPMPIQNTEIVLNNPGEIQKFHKEEPVTVDLSDVDFSKDKVVSDIVDDDVTMSCQENPDQETSIIYLTNKCEIIHVGMGQIPAIITSGSATGEQIIVTPWIDEDCNQKGFEIRAGSIESGCKNGRDNLLRLKSCKKKHHLKSLPTEIKKSTKAKKSTVKKRKTETKKNSRNSMSDEWKNYKWQPDPDER